MNAVQEAAVRQMRTERFSAFLFDVFPKVLTRIADSYKAAQASGEGKTSIQFNTAKDFGESLYKEILNSAEFRTCDRITSHVMRQAANSSVKFTESSDIDDVIAHIQKMSVVPYENLLHQWYKSCVEIVAFFVKNHKKLTEAARLGNAYDMIGSPDIAKLQEQFAQVLRRNVPSLLNDEMHDASLGLIFVAANNAEKDNWPHDKSGREFELKCKQWLGERDFDTHLTPATSDYGADIIAEKHGIRYAIQCKSGRTQAGIKSIQEAVAACKHYSCDYSAVISEASFTRNALELARRNAVLALSFSQLWMLERAGDILDGSG